MLSFDLINFTENSITMDSSVNLVNIDWNILWTIINLFILYILLKKFLFGPIMKVMEKRQENIDSKLKDADTAVDKANELKEQYEEKLSDVNTESVKLIKDAKTNAKNEYERIVTEADKKSKKLVNDAKSQIDLEYKQTMKTLKSDVAHLVMSATEKVVGDKVEIDDNRIYNDFIVEAEKDETIIDYAVYLKERKFDKIKVADIKKTIKGTPELMVALSNPTVTLAEKEHTLIRIFDEKEIQEFLLKVCRDGNIASVISIVDCFQTLTNVEKDVIKMKLICVEKPSSTQEEKIKKYVSKKFRAENVNLDVVIDKSLVGGFIIQVGDVEFDHSLKGKLDELWLKLVGEVK